MYVKYVSQVGGSGGLSTWFGNVGDDPPPPTGPGRISQSLHVPPHRT